ncbi:MAG: hypothetical protein B6226_04495 [Candidatus Cloacimonetes bacterium 4572_65]|nr:MAG: hypothetical protein B6226_04495 [Candidatus Cloacimonetes bacterium 4572_65]
MANLETKERTLGDMNENDRDDLIESMIKKVTNVASPEEFADKFNILIDELEEGEVFKEEFRSIVDEVVSLMFKDEKDYDFDDVEDPENDDDIEYLKDDSVFEEYKDSLNELIKTYGKDASFRKDFYLLIHELEGLYNI